jgi:hypothetical protein
MADRKFIGLWVAAFIAVVLAVAGSAAWADEGKVERTRDVFQLGDTGCEAVITYKNGQILKAITRPINPSGPASCSQDVTHRAKPIQNFVVCGPDPFTGDLDLTNCQVLAGVEQTVVEENTGSCTYPVNTRTGQRLVIPLPGCS